MKIVSFTLDGAQKYGIMKLSWLRRKPLFLCMYHLEKYDKVEWQPYEGAIKFSSLYFDSSLTYTDKMLVLLKAGGKQPTPIMTEVEAPSQPATTVVEFLARENK